MIMQKGTALSGFNADRSIDSWLSSGQGTSHVEGNQLPGPPKPEIQLPNPVTINLSGK